MNEFSIRVTVQGIAELTAAINRLAGAKADCVPLGGNASVPNQEPQQMPDLTQRVPSQIPQAMPQMPGQMLQMPAVPTGMPVQGYALEQLQVAAAGLMSAGKGQQVMGILQRFGIQAMTELPKEHYGEFAMALREAGAQV